MISHYTIHIYGKVQRVGFRIHAQLRAMQLEIRGYVSNEPNGSVRIEAEGEEKNLDEFIEWCRIGPSHAKVEKLDFIVKPLEGYAYFNIRN